MEHQYTNALINESSPYLLQHAHNPVNWVSWSEEAFARARNEDKLVLISIGYSACHWCHVMEHESFENEEVASIMNRHFICIKIDREEHPHIDSLYMTAVQLMSKQGGWPLNCFVLPDGRPVYGGTYFPKSSWIGILNSLEQVYRNEQQKVLDYAERITDYIQSEDLLIAKESSNSFDLDLLKTAVASWKESFDPIHGGPKRAPKFPLPTNYSFLLHYATQMDDSEVKDHAKLALSKMAKGGIFDQLGGGFARYSVDELWKVPHFEKMLYDNAQLISLYAEAFAATENELFSSTAKECIAFVEKELTNPQGGFYAALDADSEGVEGKYYTWTVQEIKDLLEPKEFNVIEQYYNLNEAGYWEHDQYILLRDRNKDQIIQQLEMGSDEFNQLLSSSKNKLLNYREKRVKPGLDNKIITSWNAMMITAYADAYRYLGESTYLNKAIETISFLEDRVYDEDKGFFHIYNQGEKKIPGLLEDQAHMISAYISLYRSSQQENWLNKAHRLTEHVLNHHSDDANRYFYFNSHGSEKLIGRQKETSDNVIPAANSVMAMNLFQLGHYFYEDSWIKRAEDMLNGISEQMMEYLPGYSNWGRLYLHLSGNHQELAICGPDAGNWADRLNRQYLPGILISASTEESELPMLKGKFKAGKTLAYLCHNKYCEKPFDNFDQVISALN